MISINGKTYFGSSISIKRNKIVIDGKVIEDDDQKQINITINGDIQTLDVGNVGGSVTTVSGDVDVEGNINGSVKTVSGDIT